MVKSRYIGDGHPTFNRNPYNGYINTYYWVDDHPLLYGNNGSLDPGTYINIHKLYEMLPYESDEKRVYFGGSYLILRKNSMDCLEIPTNHRGKTKE